MVKVVVGGCSFSSPFNLPQEKSWPSIVAKALSTSLVDEAAMAGSNYRIWRRIVGHVINGNVQPDDYVFIQYTEPHRNEYYTPTTRQPPQFKDQHQFLEEYGTGYIVKNKWGVENHYKQPEANYSKMSHFFSCEEFDHERFLVNHTMFEGYLKSLGFNRVYFLTTRYVEKLQSIYPVIDCTDALQEQWHIPDDPWHLNEAGHRNVASRMLDAIRV